MATEVRANARRLLVVTLVFPGATPLDFVGPWDVFASAAPALELKTVSWRGEACDCEGLRIAADFSFANCPQPDVLVLPGGKGNRLLLDEPEVTAWVSRTHCAAQVTLSVCTGALFLAAAGALDGLEVTTHHSALSLLKKLAPAATVVSSGDARFVEQGKLVTCGGVSSGVDGALRLVDRLCGPSARALAQRRIEYGAWRATSLAGGSLKVVILAAGYGTRLEHDLRADPSGRFTRLLGLPKPLVPVGGVPLISHWLRILAEADIHCDDVYVVTNAHFYAQFAAWARNEGFPLSHITNDGTKSNEARLGAIADMELVVREQKIEGDVMVIGGDTLFFDDFSLRHVLERFREARAAGCDLVTWYHDENTRKTGILETDASGRVVAFLEKPAPETTRSRQACPCFYLYRASTMALLPRYLAEARSQKDKDAPGNFLAWLHSRSPVQTMRISGRFDIGGLDSYIEADEHFAAKLRAVSDPHAAAVALRRWAVSVGLALGVGLLAAAEALARR